MTTLALVEIILAVAKGGITIYEALQDHGISEDQLKALQAQLSALPDLDEAA